MLHFAPLRRPFLTLFALLGLAGAGLTTGCATDQQVIAQAADVHKQLEPSVVENPQLAAYVQKVGDRIVKSGQELHGRGEFPQAESWMFEGIQFHLVASPTMNAFTTGGKHVYLYSELFENSGDEAAFAAVVGHEFGHILGRHVQSGMNDQMKILAGSGLVGLAAAALSDNDSRVQTGVTAAGAAAAVGGGVLMPGFTRGHERQADEYGFDMYVNAGYPPDQFPDFFKTMIEQGYAKGGGGLNAYLSDHPELQDRVDVAEKRAKAISPQQEAKLARPPIADSREFARLQSVSKPLTIAAAKAEKNQPKTSAFVQSQELLDAFPKCVGDPQPGEKRPG